MQQIKFNTILLLAIWVCGLQLYGIPVRDKDFFLIDNSNYQDYGADDKQLVDSLLLMYHDASEDTTKLRAVESIVEGMYHDDWHKYNIYAAELSKIILSKSSSNKVIRRCKEVTAGTHFNEGYWDDLHGNKNRAIGHYRYAAIQFQELGDTNLVLECYINIGYQYKDIGGLDSGIKYMAKSYQLASKTNNLIKQIKALIGLSLFYKLNGDNDRQVKTLFKVLRLSESMNYKKGIAEALNNIAVYYYEVQNYKKAVLYLERSLKYFEINSHQAADAYNNLGVMYTDMGDLEKAKDANKKAMTIRKEVNDQRGLSESYHNLGSIFREESKLDSARYYYKQSIILKREIGNRFGLIETLNNLAHMSLSEEEYNKALSYSLEALQLSQEAKDISAKLMCHETVSAVYESKGIEDKALFHFKRFVELRDSVRNEKSQLLAQEKEYELINEKKEAEIMLLNERNKVQELELIQKNNLIWYLSGAALFVLMIIGLVFRILKTKASQQKAEFFRKQAELKQQVLRAQMNPHFLFNSLNSIQRIYVEGDIARANDYMADFSTLLRNILNNTEKEKVRLLEDIDMLKLYLEIEKIRTDDLINYEIIIDPSINISNVRIPPMIIQPFVENAIWHGILPSKKPGKIRLSVKDLESRHILCVVEDDGIGINKSKKNKRDNHNSRAIELTRERLGEEGAIKEEELKTGGTRITIKIPKL